MNSSELLSRLVAFDTTSRRSNLELIDFVRNLLDDHGIPSRLVPSVDGTRANLYATIGPADHGGVMLSGHTDVVPTLGQDWHSDPWSLKTDDTRHYGRGSCDMKGFIASVLAALPAMTAASLGLPIHLAFSYDEEIGCVGARRLVEAMRDFGVRPRIGLIGEPTGMNLVLGHKGKRAYRVTISGLSCHSAYITSGVNAVEYAAELIAFIRAMNRRMVEQNQLDENYSVPHSTFHVGHIEGGTALNIVPNACHFEFEIRNLPRQALETLAHEVRHFADRRLLPEMRERHPQSDIRFDELSDYPGLHTDPASLVADFARQVNPAAQFADPVSFGTEAGLFNEIGIDCLVCGPGSIDQAHKPDEFVARGQLERCDRMIESLVAQCRRFDDIEAASA